MSDMERLELKIVFLPPLPEAAAHKLQSAIMQLAEDADRWNKNTEVAGPSQDYINTHGMAQGVERAAEPEAKQATDGGANQAKVDTPDYESMTYNELVRYIKDHEFLFDKRGYELRELKGRHANQAGVIDAYQKEVKALQEQTRYKSARIEEKDKAVANMRSLNDELRSTIAKLNISNRDYYVAATGAFNMLKKVCG